MGFHPARLNLLLTMMTNRRPFHLLALAALWAGTALGQPVFKVDSSNEPTPEGASVSVLLVQTDHERFSLRLPKGYGAQVRQDGQSIEFTSASGSSIMTVQWSTNYPGALPQKQPLAETVAARHPLASLVQISTCYTAYATGLMFDLFQPTAGKPTLRMREAYVACPEGSIEFTLTCNLADYDKARLSFAWLLNSFRSADDTARKKQ